MRRCIVPWMPAALLLSSAFWTGNFQAPMRPAWVFAGHLILLVVAAWVLVVGRAGSPDVDASVGARSWLRADFLMILGTLLWVSVQWFLLGDPSWASRAVWLALPLLLLPSWVASCWRTPLRRRRGIQAMAGVVAVVAAHSLVQWGSGQSERAALPLGHHNILALWLLTLLPLVSTLLVVRHGVSRGLGWLAVGLSVAAILASGSLAAWLGLTCWLLLSLWWTRPVMSRLPWPGASTAVRRTVVAGLLVALLVPVLWQGDRLEQLSSGDDTSWLARLAYWQGAWQGIEERPWGWGVGSTPWTLSPFLGPHPGVLPAGEVVADVHNLPLSLLYELGWPGALLLLGWVVVLASRFGRRGAGAYRRHPAAIALGVFVVTSLGGAAMYVEALPIVILIALGTGMTLGRRRPLPDAAKWRASAPWLPALIVSFNLALQLLPIDMAAMSYGRATEVESAEAACVALRQARRWDPRQSLYRLAIPHRQRDGAPSAESPCREMSRGALPEVGPLLLLAGQEMQRRGQLGEGRDVLLRACAADPLGAMAPFFLAGGEPENRRAAEWTARALMAEPRLLAARIWRRHPDPLANAVDLLEGHPGIDAGWRARLAESYGFVLADRAVTSPDWRQLALSMDRDPATSVSLHAFRRRPWQRVLATVELDAGVLEWLDLVSLSELRSTDPRLFAANCRLGGAADTFEASR